jgi:hypothetical protein
VLKFERRNIRQEDEKNERPKEQTRVGVGGTGAPNHSPPHAEIELERNGVRRT